MSCLTRMWWEFACHHPDDLQFLRYVLVIIVVEMLLRQKNIKYSNQDMHTKKHLCNC